ncbi:hypothetical protein [Ornithobacterium rhinotracheale]|uniref:hypothetical protein n=1 Tax=Ornithobacterium rhinotracheale TaxID=28251 RepID=UPI00403986D9
MIKKIYKLSLVAFLGFSSLMYGQENTTKESGAVGINLDEGKSPEATLDIRAKDLTGTSVEGVLVPRVTAERAEKMGENVAPPTLIYIKDAKPGLQEENKGKTISLVNGSGLYYFDPKYRLSNKGKWVRVDGKTLAVRLNQTYVPNYKWEDENGMIADYYEFTEYSASQGEFKLPNVATCKGLTIMFKNSTKGAIQFTSSNTGVEVPFKTMSITASSAQKVYSDGEKWHLMIGRN